LLLSTADTDLLAVRACGADYRFANPARTELTERTGSAPMTSDSGVLISASVRIDGKTEINYRVYEGGLVEFSIGDGEFDLVTTEPLDNLVDRAQAALRAALSAVSRNDEGCATE
jgi:hypothetical protein